MVSVRGKCAQYTDHQITICDSDNFAFHGNGNENNTQERAKHVCHGAATPHTLRKRNFNVVRVGEATLVSGAPPLFPNLIDGLRWITLRCIVDLTVDSQVTRRQTVAGI